MAKFCWKTKRTHTAHAEPFGLQFCYENNPVFSYRKKKKILKVYGYILICLNVYLVCNRDWMAGLQGAR